MLVSPRVVVPTELYSATQARMHHPSRIPPRELSIEAGRTSGCEFGMAEADSARKKMEEGDKFSYKPQTVKLVSAEGFEFIVDRKAAMISNTLRNMLSSTGGFTETELGEVSFPEISAPILEKVCQYFYWSLQSASGEETAFHIEPEMTLELMMAANYLHT